jgi:ribonuclease HI
MKLLEIRQTEELEIELIRKQGLNSIITNQLVEILTRNKKRDKRKYSFYTDGALYKKKEENDIGKMGIGWVQVEEKEDWPEEEIALGLEGWPSATIAELAAIWAAILTVPEGKSIEVFTDSIAALRNINRALQSVEKERILKKKNAMWIMNIVGLIKSKNIKIEIIKVKSHSENKWNDRADLLAKKGAKCRNEIYADKVKCDGIEYHLEWENKKIDIPARLLCKIIANAKIGANWRETNPI